jgi:hypothetical protein
MFRSKKNLVTVSIAHAALESIFDECDRYNLDETGGRLLGTFHSKGAHLDITVNGVIDPGPSAQRSNTSFFQDGEYQEKVFREVEARHPDVEHLGNWHTHHVNGYPTLSGGDITTYHNIVNHKNHNIDFFYALLVVRKNSGNPRYDVRHYLFRRGEDNFHEIPHASVHMIDAPLLTAGRDVQAESGTASPAEARKSNANPERAKDKDFFREFYPRLKAQFSEKLGTFYWKGPLTLIDGSAIDIVAAESTDGLAPEYSIITSPKNTTCPDIVTGYKDRTFPAARHALINFERDLNQALYQERK